MFPFNESRAKVGVVTVPVKLELLISLYEIKATDVVPFTFPAKLNQPALDSRITLLPATLLFNAVVKFVVAELVAITEYVPLAVFAELVKLNVVTPLLIDALAKATLAVALSLTYTLPFNA